MTHGEKLDGLAEGHSERQRNSGRPKSSRMTVPCSACDKPATVPFAPKPGEPVYCNECFQPQPKNIRLDARTPLFPTKGLARGGGRGGWNGRSQSGYRNQRGNR